MKPSPGFTLVELVAIILLAGILAAVAGPRFFSTNTYAGRGYYDQAGAFLRYAQKRAIARHGTVAVLVDSGGLALCASAVSPCPDELPGPDGEDQYRVTLPDGITQTASAASLSFDAQGRPDAAFTLAISGDLSRSLTVEAETGYVH